MVHRDALRVPIRATITDAGLGLLRSPPVEEGRIWVVEILAWEVDKTMSGGNTRARLYIIGPGWEHYLEEQDAPAADTLYTYSETFRLYPTERVGLELDENQATTLAQMWITGYSEAL